MFGFCHRLLSARCRMSQVQRHAWIDYLLHTTLSYLAVRPNSQKFSIVSPPSLLQIARQTPMAILFEMNRVEPSHIDDCTPPACRLREAIIVGVEAVATMQGGFRGLFGLHWPPAYRQSGIALLGP